MRKKPLQLALLAVLLGLLGWYVSRLGFRMGGEPLAIQFRHIQEYPITEFPR